MSGNFTVLAVFTIYMAFMMWIGILSGKESTNDEQGFYLGNRSFGFYSTAMSSAATDTSGWIYIGAVGYAYMCGIEFMWMVPGYALGGVISWLMIGPKLRRQSESLEAMDLIDYFEKRLDDKAHILKIIGGLLIILFFIPYMGSQLKSAAITMNVILDTNYILAMIITAAIVTSYCFFGGYKAVVWTDTVQGTLMLLVLLGVPVYFIFGPLGGWESFWTQVYGIDPHLTDVVYGKGGNAAFGMVLGYLTTGIGTIGQPHNLQRYFATKDAEDVFYKGMWVKAAFNIISMTGACLLGLIARVIMPEIADPEYAFPTLIYGTFSPVICGVIIAGIFAAIQSTFDSQLLVAVQTVASDFLPIVSRKKFGERAKVHISRITMIVLSVLAFIIAVLDIDTVFYLILFASNCMASAFGPLLVFLLCAPQMVTKKSAIAAMLVGAGVATVWYVSGLTQTVIWEIVPGMLSATIVIIALHYFIKGEREFVETKDDTMNHRIRRN